MPQRFRGGGSGGWHGGPFCGTRAGWKTAAGRGPPHGRCGSSLPGPGPGSGGAASACSPSPPQGHVEASTGGGVLSPPLSVHGRCIALRTSGPWQSWRRALQRHWLAGSRRRGLALHGPLDRDSGPAPAVPKIGPTRVGPPGACPEKHHLRNRVTSSRSSPSTSSPHKRREKGAGRHTPSARTPGLRGRWLGARGGRCATGA